MELVDCFQSRNYDEVLTNNTKLMGLEDSTPSPNRGSAKIEYGIVSSDHVVKSIESR